MNTIVSYSYADLDKTTKAARGVLTGPAICQYDNLFKVVRREAPRQRLVVTASVTSSGVQLLQRDRARVLIFATQSARTGNRPATSAGAMFAVNAVRDGGGWKIENIDTFAEAQSQDCG